MCNAKKLKKGNKEKCLTNKYIIKCIILLTVVAPDVEERKKEKKNI